MAISSWFLGLIGGGAGRRQPGLQTGLAGSQPSRPATSVNEDTALCLSAFWACVKLISETVASMPLVFYDINPDGSRSINTSHPLAILLSRKPNLYQTRVEFWETMTMQKVIHGNAFALKQKSSDGKRIIGLLPLMSPQMEVILGLDGSVNYRYNNGREVMNFTPDQIWHNKLFGNGIVGLSPLSYARNSIGVGLAADNRTSRIFQNGAKPAGMLKTDTVLKQDQRDAIRLNFKELAEGESDTLFVLEAGMEYQQLSLSPKDVELLQSRSFQTKDVARFMGVPSVLINDTDAATAWGTGIAQIIDGFYKFGLRPYLERYEASIIANLLDIKDFGKVEAEFDFNSLLRADMKTRFETYKSAVSGGFMTPNQARICEGWEKEPGGDELYMQQQMVPLSYLAKGEGLKLGTGNGGTKYPD